MAQQNLTPEEEALARRLYAEFFTMCPGKRNPSDINTPEKAQFLIMKGFEQIRLMQRARKAKYPFTRPDEVETDDE